MLRLDHRSDISLSAFERVAWGGEAVQISAEALKVIDRCHDSFAALVAKRLAADPASQIYGVTSGPGDAGPVDLERDTRPSRLWTAASFGEPLPSRVVRGIILARLANFIEGNAGVRADVARSVAAMLDSGAPLPPVPAQGTGGAGEILPLGHLFYDLTTRLRVEPKERMALINGSPCAAALVADVSLAARGRTALAETVFALSVEALGSPLEAYSEDLEVLWDDTHETAALRSLRALLEGHRHERMAQQSPVSHRILPRELGRIRRAQAEAERTAAVSLRAVTDNPVYVPPDAARPLGAVLSNGGFHNAQAAAAIDAVAFSWADVCQLAERHVEKLFLHPSTAGLLADEFTYRPLHMAGNGWAEEARSLAVPTLLSLGGFGQNDVSARAFAAWRKAAAIGRCVEASLAVLATLSARVLVAQELPIPPALADLVGEVSSHVPAVTEARRLGPDVEALAQTFTARILPRSEPRDPSGS